MADRAEDNRGGHQELMFCGRGPTKWYGYCEESDKSLKTVEEETPAEMVS
jgi:hypothetical protein